MRPLRSTVMSLKSSRLRVSTVVGGPGQVVPFLQTTPCCTGFFIPGRSGSLSARTTVQLIPPSQVVAINGYQVPAKSSAAFPGAVSSPSVPVGLSGSDEFVARKNTAARLLSPATAAGKTETLSAPAVGNELVIKPRS